MASIKVENLLFKTMIALNSKSGGLLCPDFLMMYYIILDYYDDHLAT